MSRPLPPGYWEDPRGNLVPLAKIKPLDKKRTQVVIDLCDAAKKASANLLAFKLACFQEVADYLQHSLDEYGVTHGGTKGNATLTTFDGKFKVVRQIQETITFDERLLAARALIDECIQDWSKGSNANIKVLVQDAFQTDQEDKISTGRVLSLRRLDIKDEKWLRAMNAIAESVQVASTKPYIRFYERDDASGKYFPINLDVAAV